MSVNVGLVKAILRVARAIERQNELLAERNRMLDAHRGDWRDFIEQTSADLSDDKCGK